MFQSPETRTEDEQLQTPLPRLPSYRTYNEVTNATSEAVQLMNESDACPPYKNVRTNATRGIFSCWKSLKQAAKWRPGRAEDPSEHWKPVTLRAPILGGFVLFSVAIIVLLEILAHISFGNGNSNGGGLAFAADVNSLSALATFGFLYLPTVIAVIYSMLWSWVDLDAKRLEPWFQLSRPEGASAKDSLLLQYPFDFLPFVPVTAGRRKHWGVFLAGTIMLLVFWIITPLQSAIFNTATAIRTLETTMRNTAALIPLQAQTDSLNANFLNTAYGISWLSQALPQFTTPQYAFLPFGPVADLTSVSNTEQWSTAVTAYGTNLSCKPADVASTLGGNAYTFSNGKGCSLPDVGLPHTHYIAESAGADIPSSSYMVLYIGYYQNPLLDYALENPNCSAEHSNNFLALYAPASAESGVGNYSNLTALFCETTYFAEEMLVTVNASDHAVVSTEINMTKSNGSAELEAVFNTTNFENILATGVTSTGQRADYQDRTVLEQFPRLRNYSLSWPVSNMVGFAVALNPLSVSDFAEPAILQGAFQKAHQLLFSTAFNAMTGPTEATEQNVRTGVRRDTLGAIIMVRSISIIVEAAFAVIAILTMALWFYSHHRSSSLVADPASIARVMSVLQSSNIPTHLFRDDGSLTSAALEKSLSSTQLRLERDLSSSKGSLQLTCRPASDDECARNSVVPPSLDRKEFSPVRPTELRLPLGFAFIGIIFASVGFLTSLRIWSLKAHGIPLPTTNTIVVSILENYLPTTFATFLEPFWVILNRLLCLLLPFDELRKGNAKASKTVEVKYTSLPPQLVFGRALGAGHLLLAAVCMAAISTNVLAVALSGLLADSPTIVNVSASMTQDLLPMFNGTPITSDRLLGAPVLYSDHFYVAIANLSSGTSLPSWVDESFFYLPFNLPSAAAVSSSKAIDVQGFRGSTFGFGADVSCSEMSHEQSNDGNHTVKWAPSQVATKNVSPNRTAIPCVRNFTTGNSGSLPSGDLALEIMETMDPGKAEGFCSSLVVAGWARLSSGTNESTFIGCTQKLRIAQFDVYVDPSGHVLDSQPITEFSDDVQKYFVGNSSELALFEEASALIAPGALDNFAWHNDSFTSDWMNVLLGIVQNGTSLVDPSQAAPAADVVGPAVEGLYRQLFTILLTLNTHVFSPSDSAVQISGEIVAVESRMFVSSTMFVLATTILALHFVVAIWYYSRRPRRFLPRMPTSIASIIAYVAASWAVQDFTSTDSDGDSDGDVRYGYGRFIGVDGKSHVGIERQRYVVPLKSRNPNVQKRRRWAWRRRSTEDEKEPRTWI